MLRAVMGMIATAITLLQNQRGTSGGKARATRHRPGERGGSFVIVAVLATTWLWLALTGPLPAAEADGPDKSSATSGLINFEEGVRIALRQSPYLVKSTLEIDIRRMDENDSRYTMVPPLTFRTYYYLNHPNQSGFNSRPYSLGFSIDPYNPLGSYFTLQAQKLATQMAIHFHLKAISEGLERLGRMFLELDALHKAAACQTDLINLARENLTYAENRQRIGTGTSLEVKVASQEWQLAQNEKEQINASQKKILANLRGFLGLKPSQDPHLDLRDVRRQVLGNFDPATATLEQAKSRSYELKAMELKKQLQGYHVLHAKTKVLPTILLNVQTPDPLSLTNARGLYAGIGLEVPVWDGFKRIRDVSRQKSILRQMGADQDVKELDLEDKWYGAQQDFANAGAALKLAQSQEELARLKDRQSEIRYHSGAEPLPSLLEGRKGVLEAQKQTAVKSMEYAKALLTLRQISGELGYSYVDANAWQK